MSFYSLTWSFKYISVFAIKLCVQRSRGKKIRWCLIFHSVDIVKYFSLSYKENDGKSDKRLNEWRRHSSSENKRNKGSGRRSLWKDKISLNKVVISLLILHVIFTFQLSKSNECLKWNSLSSWVNVCSDFSTLTNISLKHICSDT